MKYAGDTIALAELETFLKASSLEINIDKIEGFWFGSNATPKRSLLELNGLVNK